MALLSQRSVDKHIFEGSPKHRNNSKHFDLSFTGSYRKIWSHTDIKLHTDTDNSQYSRSTFERDTPPPLWEDEPEICRLSAPPCPLPLNAPAKQAASSSSSPACLCTSLQKCGWRRAHIDCAYTYDIRHVAAMFTYTTQTNRSSYSLGFTFSLQK